MIRLKVPIGPVRVAFPMVNSTMSRGTDQMTRKITQATRNDPPPFAAAMRGNRQMFPVPTAMPSMAIIIPQREVNVCWFSVNASPGLGTAKCAKGAERVDPVSPRLCALRALPGEPTLLDPYPQVFLDARLVHPFLDHRIAITDSD